MCGDRPASMEKAAVQGYAGDTVDISVDVHRLLETMDGIDFLAVIPPGREGIAMPMAQHSSTLGNVIVTIAVRGLPQDAGELPVARACVNKLRHAFSWRLGRRVSPPPGGRGRSQGIRKRKRDMNRLYAPGWRPFGAQV